MWQDLYTAISGSPFRTALLAVRKICVPEAVGCAGLGACDTEEEEKNYISM